MMADKATLDALGKQGWEWITAVPGLNEGIILLLKRPLTYQIPPG
jgi:hypothetical protein